VSRSDAVDDTGIPPIQFRSQVVEEDHRHSGIRPKLPVHEFRAAHIDASGWYIVPRAARAELRLMAHARARLLAPRARWSAFLCNARRALKKTDRVRVAVRGRPALLHLFSPPSFALKRCSRTGGQGTEP
jgi:hypothetical protein